MKKDSFEVPLILYHTLIKLMDDKRILFPDAYKELEDEGKIKVINKVLFLI